MTENFSIIIRRENLRFTACHWIKYWANNEWTVEPLHGHTFQVSAKISGPVDENGLLLDFVSVEHSLHEILEKLEHKILIPVLDPDLTCQKEDNQLKIAIFNKKWEFPAEDSLFLPFTNISTEFIAQWIAEKLLQNLQKKNLFSNPHNRYILQVSVEEERGYLAEYTLYTFNG